MEIKWESNTIFIVSMMIFSTYNAKSNPGNIDVDVKVHHNGEKVIDASYSNTKLKPRSEERCLDERPKCLSVQDCKYLHLQLQLCGPKKDVTECYKCSPSWKEEDADTCKSCKYIGPRIGRPFIVKGAVRTTNSQSCSFEKNCDSQEWMMGETPSVLANASLNQEIGRRWLEHAEGEHASVASFARNTLQLMAMGSPPDLLIASQNAAIDEIRHAKLSYGIASAYLKTDFGPGTIDVEGSLPKLDLKGLVHSIIEEGCIEETIAAAMARYGAYTANEPTIRSALGQIGDDETRHAQLAWDTIKWIITKFPEVRVFVQDIFEVEVQNRSPFIDNTFKEMPTTLCLANDINTAFRNHGLIVDEDKNMIRKYVIQNVIKPIYQEGFHDVKSISKELLKMDFSLV